MTQHLVTTKAHFPRGYESVISGPVGLLLMVAGVICFVKCYSGMSSGDTDTLWRRKYRFLIIIVNDIVFEYK